MMVGGAAAILDAFMTAIATSAKGPEASQFGPRKAVKDGGDVWTIGETLCIFDRPNLYPGKLVGQYRPGNILAGPNPCQSPTSPPAATRSPRQPIANDPQRLLGESPCSPSITSTIPAPSACCGCSRNLGSPTKSFAISASRKCGRRQNCARFIRSENRPSLPTTATPSRNQARSPNTSSTARAGGA